MKRLDLAAWIRTQKQLLQIERETEIAQLSEKIASLSAVECQDAGLSLLHMQIDNVSSGLFGRVVVTLSRQDKKPLPKSFKVGDEVSLYCPKSKHSSEAEGDAVMGIVSKTTQAMVDIVVDEIDENEYPAPVRLDLRASEQTFKQYMKALSDLESGPPGPLSDLFFGDGRDIGETIETRPYRIDREQLYNPNLNDSQIKAVESSIATSRVAVIHGPPGTGKTSTVAELILHAVNRHEQKLLVCAPSNVAVDNILERLVQLSKKSASRSGRKNRNQTQGLQLRVARLGHPARVSPVTQPYCLDSLIARDDGSEIVADVRKDIDKLQKELAKRGKRYDRAQRKEMQAEMRVLRKEVRKREEAVVREIMQSRQVILCTCTTASSRLIRDMEFDFVIIDEAAQAMEVACWIPLSKTRKCILVGDHNQLPPTVKSNEAANGGLGVTLFERVIRDPRFAPVVHLLDTQYRMNRLICEWASKAMYEGALVSHPSVAEHTVADLHAVGQTTTAAAIAASNIGSSSVGTMTETVGEEDEEIELYDDDGLPVHVDRKKNVKTAADVDGDDDRVVEPVMLLLDTSGAEMSEESANEGSYRNSGEAHVVMKHVLSLLDDRGLNPREIGVITPYNGQLEALRQLFTSDGSDSRLQLVEVRTVDGFQGGERECIVISMVRSNTRKEVGFLGDKRRINVAVTRARRHLAIVCDTETCSADPFIRGLIEHIASVGEQRSVFEGYITELWQSTGVTTSSSSSAVASAHSTSAAKSAGGSSNATRVTKLHKDASSSSSSASSTQKKPHGQSASSVGGTRGNGIKTEGQKPSYTSSVDREAANAAFKEAVQSVVKEFKRDKDGGTVALVELYAGDMLRIMPPTSSGVVDPGGRQLADQLSSLNIDPTQPRTLRFNATLTSQQRRVVHEVAEEMNIPHRSLGEGANRYIELCPQGFHDEQPQTQPLPPLPSPPAEPNSMKQVVNSPTSAANTPSASTSSAVKVGAVAVQPLQSTDKSTGTLTGTAAAQQGGGRGSCETLGGAAAAVELKAAAAPRAVAKGGVGVYMSAERAAAIAAKEAAVDAILAAKQPAAVPQPANDGQQQSQQQKSKDKSEKDDPSKKKKKAAGGGKNGNNGDKNNNGAGGGGCDDDDDMDEIAMLEAAIEANRQLARYNQYRLSATAMPNPEKERHKEQLRSRITEAQAARRVTLKEGDDGKDGESSSKGKQPSSHNKKVVKKPPPNFGGGRLGSS